MVEPEPPPPPTPTGTAEVEAIGGCSCMDGCDMDES